jgi:hypothetical protein
LRITASVNALVFNSQEFARFLTDKTIPNAPEGNVQLNNKENLNVSIVTENIGDEEEPEFVQKVNIEGDIEISWLVDETKLVEMLVGKDRGSFTSIISEQKGIRKAEVSLSPFWKNSFPKASRIEVFIEK